MSLSKSLIHFLAKADPNLASVVSQQFAIPKTINLGKYLGILTTHGRGTFNTYKFILDKVYSRLECWKNKYLSYVGLL